MTARPNLLLLKQYPTDPTDLVIFFQVRNSTVFYRHQLMTLAQDSSPIIIEESHKNSLHLELSWVFDFYEG